jgi:prepilin-type N-terminal cleavage/methylation domain-containing protein
MHAALNRGFSIIEIAVVMVIISVMITLLAAPLSGQIEQRRTEETQKILDSAREAVVGFTIANGRLPCPATATSAGMEAFAVGGNATNGQCAAFTGLLPAVTLSISPVDEGGFALDAWGLTQNRIRYAVRDLSVAAPSGYANCTNTVALNQILTSTNGMRTATMSCLAETNLTILTICSLKPDGAPGAASSCSIPLTSKAPFVILSLGKNAPTGGVDIDEAHNVDTDAFFVSHPKTAQGSTSGEFDDIVVWGSLNTLFARMVQAGKLP